MTLCQGLLFLLLGGGLLGLAYQGQVRGWLPCGSNGFKARLDLRKEEQPAAFWAMFAVYLLAGLALTLYALLLLTGRAQPLPLR